LQEIACEFRTGGILQMVDFVVAWCIYVSLILYKRQLHLWYCYEEVDDTEGDVPNWMQCVWENLQQMLSFST
jgi:hypothetical protein